MTNATRNATRNAIFTLRENVCALAGVDMDTRRWVKKAALKLSKMEDSALLVDLMRSRAEHQWKKDVGAPASARTMCEVDTMIAVRAVRIPEETNIARVFSTPAEYRQKLIDKVGVHQKYIKSMLYTVDETAPLGKLPDGSDLPEPASRNVKGQWVHALRKSVNLRETESVTGEICVSSYGGSGWFCNDPRTAIAMLFEGTASAYFRGDCFSKVLADGSRYPTCCPEGQGHGHDEGFLVPCEARLVAVLVGEDVLDEVVADIQAQGYSVRRVRAPVGTGIRPVRIQRLPLFIEPDEYSW